ncbi:hypothetical protein BC936DRAFT_143446 [Jimgerdemannia flammicorona]|uniref:Uncharacterized protein n=1 Tax=Jimgerdemannia flammicorona TaxID=994334 RepID=A0A433DDV6_9FUNG|nr:hypothetical protein BC936DRAFT_143446 [Jimgerdemannia flammicorona]
MDSRNPIVLPPSRRSGHLKHDHLPWPVTLLLDGGCKISNKWLPKREHELMLDNINSACLGPWHLQWHVDLERMRHLLEIMGNDCERGWTVQVSCKTRAELDGARIDGNVWVCKAGRREEEGGEGGEEVHGVWFR